MESNAYIDEAIERYSDMVYQLAFSQTGSRYDAEDVYQEVFLKLVKNRTAFVSEEHRKAWLIRVTLNSCHSLWRSICRRKAHTLEGSGQAIEFVLPEETQLYAALCKLPAKYRMVIHLFYYEQMSVRQISQSLGVKETTVRSQLMRARNMLRVNLQEEGV